MSDRVAEGLEKIANGSGRGVARPNEQGGGKKRDEDSICHRFYVIRRILVHCSAPFNRGNAHRRANRASDRKSMSCLEPPSRAKSAPISPITEANLNPGPQ